MLIKIIFFIRWHAALQQLISTPFCGHILVLVFMEQPIGWNLEGFLITRSLSLWPLLIGKHHYVTIWESECAGNRWWNPDVLPFMVVPYSDFHIHILRIIIIFQYWNRCIFTMNTFLQNYPPKMRCRMLTLRITCFMLISCLLLIDYSV